MAEGQESGTVRYLTLTCEQTGARLQARLTGGYSGSGALGFGDSGPDPDDLWWGRAAVGWRMWGTANATLTITCMGNEHVTTLSE